MKRAPKTMENTRKKIIWEAEEKSEQNVKSDCFGGSWIRSWKFTTICREKCIAERAIERLTGTESTRSMATLRNSEAKGNGIYYLQKLVKRPRNVLSTRAINIEVQPQINSDIWYPPDLPLASYGILCIYPLVFRDIHPTISSAKCRLKSETQRPRRPAPKQRISKSIHNQFL